MRGTSKKSVNCKIFGQDAWTVRQGYFEVGFVGALFGLLFWASKKVTKDELEKQLFREERSRRQAREPTTTNSVQARCLILGGL